MFLSSVARSKRRVCKVNNPTALDPPTPNPAPPPLSHPRPPFVYLYCISPRFSISFYPSLSVYQTLFSFEADATELVPDVFSLGFEDEYEELEADLQEFSEKFADSPAAQAS